MKTLLKGGRVVSGRGWIEADILLEDDKISKEFYYLGHMTASGKTKEFKMANTEKTAVEIEWILDVPVREDIYEYIVNS